MLNFKIIAALSIILSSLSVSALEKTIYCKESEGLYKSLEFNVYPPEKKAESVKFQDSKIIFTPQSAKDHVATPFIKTATSLLTILPSDTKISFSIQGGNNYNYSLQSSDSYKELFKGIKTGTDVTCEISEAPEKIRLVFSPADINKTLELPTRIEIKSITVLNNIILKEMCIAVGKRLMIFGGLIAVITGLFVYLFKNTKRKSTHCNNKSNKIFKIYTFFMVPLFIGFFLECSAVLWLYTHKYEWTKEKPQFFPKNNFTEALSDAGMSLADFMHPHPYLGFVYKKIDGFPYSANNTGFFGKDFPYQKAPDKFYILITGGSVAALFGQMKVNGVKYLEEILNSRYDWSGKEVVVLNAGLGGGLQPQQLIALELYANVIDGFISIEGFNEFLEISVTNLKLGRISRNFDDINPYAASGGYFQMLLSFANAKVENSGKKKSSALIKYLTYKITYNIKNHLEYTAKNANGRTTVDSLFAFPEKWNSEQRFKYNIDIYKNNIRMMDAVAKKINIKSLFILQPVPVIGKTLTVEENNNIKGEPWNISGNDKKYHQMINELLTLRGEEIPIYDILDIFKDCKDTIYADPIHCTFYGDKDESKGHKMMAEKIADIIEKDWNLKRKNNL